eukprot:5533348-Heterocapsa_arctica.AAC.1
MGEQPGLDKARTIKMKQVNEADKQDTPSVEKMNMLVTHGEVPPVRSCIEMVRGKTATAKDIGLGCEGKACITCLAKRNTTGCTSDDYNMTDSQILELWSSMVESHEYKNSTIPEKVDALCVMLMKLGGEDRKHLSKMGAVRFPREKFLEFLRSKDSTQ